MGKIFGTLYHGSGVIGSNLYLADNGAGYEITSQIQLPQDIAETSFAQSLALIVGGALTKFNGEVLIPTSGICSNKGIIKPRKLTFIRANNNNISIVIPSRLNIINVATLLRTSINAANPSLPVVCIKLTGESFLTLNDLLGITEKDEIGVAVSAEPSSGGLGSNYSRVHEYRSDAIFNSIVLTNYQIRTNNPFEIPSFLGELAAQNCLGLPVSILGCGSANKFRDHRRFYLDIITTDNVSERREIPVTNAQSDVILDCGRNLAALPGVYCIGYKGEDNSRIHLLL